MRPMSKKAKADAYDGVKADRDVLQELAHILVGGEEVTAIRVIDQCSELYDKHAHIEEGEVHEYRLYRATWGHGGIVMYAHHLKGQRPSVTAYMFERWIEQVGEFPHGIGLGTEIKIVCEHFQRARREAYDRQFGPKCPGCGHAGVGTAQGLPLYCDKCADARTTAPEQTDAADRTGDF